VIPGGIFARNDGAMTKHSHWDGKVHKAEKFGNPFDWRTVKGLQRAAQIREWRRRHDEVKMLMN
jgi:hypothetical protein